MERDNRNPTGIKRLINECRKQFRIPENLNHYSEDDYREAEKRYVKFCLRDGDNRNRVDFEFNRGEARLVR